MLWRSGREIRDLIADYFAGRGRFPDRPDGNWRIVPPMAVDTLVREGMR